MKVECGDALELCNLLGKETIQTCITSPPYWTLRDYGVFGQYGLESKPSLYIEKLANVFDGVLNSLKKDGILWLNVGDTQAGYWGNRITKESGNPSLSDRRGFVLNSRPRFSEFKDEGFKPTDLIGIPWMLAFELRRRGWYLRAEVIWSKPNRREGKSDKYRPTRTHEQIFMLTKSSRGIKCYRDCDFNSVWNISVSNGVSGHIAPFPEKLVERCILSSTDCGDIILDPFCGSGTVGIVAAKLSRNFVGIDISPEYVAIAKNRIEKASVHDTLPDFQE
jgi:DNA modification methylase